MYLLSVVVCSKLIFIKTYQHSTAHYTLPSLFLQGCNEGLFWFFFLYSFRARVLMKEGKKIRIIDWCLLFVEVIMYTNPISVIKYNIVIAANEQTGNTVLPPALFIKNKNLLQSMHLHWPSPLESEILNPTITYLLRFLRHTEIPMYFISAWPLCRNVLQQHSV